MCVSVCVCSIDYCHFSGFELCVLTPFSATSLALLCHCLFNSTFEFSILGFYACILFLCSFFCLFLLIYLVVKINVACPCFGRFTFSLFLSIKFNYIQFYTSFIYYFNIFLTSTGKLADGQLIDKTDNNVFLKYF